MRERQHSGAARTVACGAGPLLPAGVGRGAGRCQACVCSFPCSLQPALSSRERMQALLPPKQGRLQAGIPRKATGRMRPGGLGGGLARAVSSHAPGRFDPTFRGTITTLEQNKVVKEQFEQALAAASSRRAEPCCSLLRACTACHPPWNRQLRRVQRRMASEGSGRAGPAGNARAAALLALLLLAATHVQGGGGLGAAVHHPGAAGCTRRPPRPRTHAASPFPPQAWCWRL